MNILAVDNERWALAQLADSIKEVVPDAHVSSFNKPLNALEYAQGADIDVAFLDIRMPALDGLGLAERLKELNPQVNIIFVTGYGEYIVEAMKLHASGFVDKPVTPYAVQEQMENLLHTFPVVQPKSIDELGHIPSITWPSAYTTMEKTRCLSQRSFPCFVCLSITSAHFSHPRSCSSRSGEMTPMETCIRFMSAYPICARS